MTTKTLVTACLFTITAAAATTMAVTAAQTAPSQTEPIFRERAELVVLHVTVTDRYRTYVAGLDRTAFTVFEDDRPQPIEFFSVIDTPVTVGLLVDSSASMYGMREVVAAGAAAFVDGSNPNDEVFAITFDDDVRPVALGAPFTNDGPALRRALTAALAARGRTALHDAILAGVRYASRGQYPRRVLIVISDGEDTASTASVDEVLRTAASSDTVIYTIALTDPNDHGGRPDRLKAFAEASGGIALRPHDSPGISSALRRISRDIRNAYTIGFAPAAVAGGSHRIRVAARSVDGEMLTVRTRHSYARGNERNMRRFAVSVAAT